MSTSRRRALAIAGVFVMITALSACAKKDPGGSAIGSVSLSPSPAGSATGGGIDGGLGSSPSPNDTSTQTATATATVSKSPKPQTTVTVTAQPTITIDEFRVAADGGPACPVSAQPGASFSSPGHDITIEWRVSGNVTAVGLSIDDPNFYKSYNGQGTYRSDYKRDDHETLVWSCDPEHTKDHFTTHTYTISTIGGGPPVARTITVKTSNDNS